MPDTSWKRWERDVANTLGGTRTGPQGEGLPDVLLHDLAPECKLQGKLRLRSRDLEQAQRNAPEGKHWALLLKERNTGRKLAIVDYTYFVDLYLRSQVV